MPDLSCAVTSCFYNKTDRCCKENIQVEGADARVMNETSCGSFRPRRGDSFVNMEAGTPEAKTSVHCWCKLAAAYPSGKTQNDGEL